MRNVGHDTSMGDDRDLNEGPRKQCENKFVANAAYEFSNEMILISGYSQNYFTLINCINLFISSTLKLYPSANRRMLCTNIPGQGS